MTQRLFAEIEDKADVAPVGELNLKGSLKPPRAVNVLRFKMNRNWAVDPHEDLIVRHH